MSAPRGNRRVAPPEAITTARLRLRRPRDTDAEAVFEYGSDPLVAHYTDWPVAESIDEIVERLAARAPLWESGAEYYWVITLPSDDRAIGAVSSCVAGRAADFGYVLSRAHWNKGYATEVSLAVVDALLALPGIDRVWATCDSENLASARVLEKCGLRREGILRRWIVRPNISETPRDAFIYLKVAVRA